MRRIVLGWDPGPTKSAWAILVQDVSAQGGFSVTRFLDGGTVPSVYNVEGAGPGMHVPFASLNLWAASLGEPARPVDRLTDIDRAAGVDRICAIEAPGGYVFHQARGAQLLKTSHVAGELATAARHKHLQLVEKTAQEWRRKFCGKPNASDAVVKHWCAMLVRDMPKRSSAHTRDAIGVAWVALNSDPTPGQAGGHVVQEREPVRRS